jgi:hypothetical protein
MKGKDEQRRPLPSSSSVVDDEAAEGLKKRLKDLGLIVNAGAGKPSGPAGKKKGGKK